MRRGRKPLQEDYNQKQQTTQGLNAFMQMVQDETGEILVLNEAVRNDAVAPPEPEITRQNPYGVQDVITFCEHPFFLGLRLTPWQRMILKLFYSGTRGNQSLQLTKERTNKCEDCVWIKCRMSEETACKAALNPNCLMLPPAHIHHETSPCLQCDKFPREWREAKFDFMMEEIVGAEKDETEILRARPITDRFQTEDDLFENDLNEDVKNQVKSKIGKRFQELILVLGRRSGKSFMVAVITLYEIYKLIKMGHPQKIYGILETETINLLNVANSEEQSKGSLFEKIKALVNTSPYFNKYIGREPTTTQLWILTPHDMEENERRAKEGIELLEGSLKLTSGHSNSATQVGGTIILVIIDEMAAMAKEGSVDGEGLDYTLYSMLKPSIATFAMDGKIICLSNPLGPNGHFYNLYTKSYKSSDMLMFQLPTWVCNPTITAPFLRGEQEKDPVNYDMHYGAEFGATGSSPFLPEWAVNAAFEKGIHKVRLEQGIPHFQYFAHLDPAKSSDLYTLVVLHLEETGLKAPDGTCQKTIVVDHMHCWRPALNFPIDSNEVDSYILDLATKFRFSQISYDQWGSQGSISKLKGYGLNVVLKSFTTNYENLIWTELYDLFVNEKIEIYNTDSISFDKDHNPIYIQEASEARNQLLKLQKKWRANNTFKVEALKGYHDDFPDAIAAAAYEALKFKSYQKLAKPKAVYTGGYGFR